MPQYQIPGARGPIPGAITDTRWQPPPKAQPPLANYAAQQMNRYLNTAKQYVHQGATVQQMVPIPLTAQPNQAAYQKQQQLRYLSPALPYVHQGATNQQTHPLPPRAQPLQAYWQQLNTLRYAHQAQEPIAGFEGTETWIPPIKSAAVYWQDYTIPIRPGVVMDIGDTLWQPKLTAQPNQAAYAKLNALRYMNQALEPLDGALTDTRWQMPPRTQPVQAYWQRQNALRFAHYAVLPIPGALVDTTWQPNPKTLPVLAYYLQQYAWQYRNHALPDQGGGGTPVTGHLFLLRLMGVG
jgi:hypothetical protein